MESGLSHSTVTIMFKRNIEPKIQTLEAIGDGFGITLSQFFAEGEEAVILTDEQREIFATWSLLSPKQKSLLLEFLGTMK